MQLGWIVVCSFYSVALFPLWFNHFPPILFHFSVATLTRNKNKMYGGGEEFFLEPTSYDIETLTSFAKFSNALRQLEKPGKKAITEAVALARDVGDSNSSYELVIGVLFRHIKTWSGNKQLSCWYVLDKLCKEDRDKYAFAAERYVLEIGRDYIPYEDEVLGPKYESLVEHWERVFSASVVEALWQSKRERLWAAEHPNEVIEQERKEEEEWEEQERAMQDIEGLNDFGQPCMDYLQGRCTWGDQCRLYHPPGEEGTLPFGCRNGDWKCKFCGVINRHFRLRCGNCVREKPQYKKERVLAPEDVLLTKPDEAVQRVLKQQFGYNIYNREEAKKHWAMRLENTRIEDYLAERKAAYTVRILKKPAKTKMENACVNMKHYPEIQIPPSPAYSDDESNERETKRLKMESKFVPGGTDAPSAAALLAQLIVERGVRDPNTPQLFQELSQQLHRITVGGGVPLTNSQGDIVVSACKLGYAAWNTNRGAHGFIQEFFRALAPLVEKLKLTDHNTDQIESMLKSF
ncbi:hypothetical protein AGDE_10281 [Angomonas deanei]|uniref:Uncharacterized protein n=1 Tax=Angomonas deanei TaxID=59799 RepID=A0A7G2C7R5_9TRYP|nr:hypothetical protein AGDE_10281 [Angomonas deanei]CAD2214857.1 hypothetical protein, conserved [Angomonas deanei]|eukprot:EPY28790.1 hypothetical protein AGDE_10281 [Angomonas deanei]